MNIREIEVYSGGVNIVKGFGGDTVDSVSGFYKDGNEFPPQQLFDQQTSSLNFAHTNDAKTNYFKIDLGKEYSVIDKVLVYNRSDCCHDRWAGSFVKLLDTDGNEIKRSEKLPSNRDEAGNYKEDGIRVKTFFAPLVTTSTIAHGMYVSEKQANDAAANYLKSGSDKRAEIEADIAKNLTSAGAGSFTASDISVTEIKVNRTGRRVWSLNITVEITNRKEAPPPPPPPPLPPLYQPPTLKLESGKIIKVVEKDIKKTFDAENSARIYAESIKSDERKRRIIINDYIKKQKESDKNFYNAEYVGVRLENKEVFIKVNVSEISIDIENLPKNKVVKVVEKEIHIYYSSSETKVRSYAESFDSNERDQGHGTKQSVIDTYIREQKESDKNFINAEYVQPFRFRFDFKNYWKDVYVKVNVSEIGDSPEEIQRKKDEEEAAEAAERAEEEQRRKEEREKDRLEKENKFYEEYPTMKKSILKEILSKSSYHFPSARTEAQKLLNEEEAAAQAAAAAQKKLEEEQKAAAAAAAAEAKKKLEEEQKAAAEAAAAEAKKKLEEAKNEQERLKAIKDAEEAKKKLEAEQKAAAEEAAAAAAEAKKKLEEEQKAAAIAAAKKKIEDEKLKYGSETWNVVILGKHVNTKSVIDYEQLQTIKISPTTTFYDIIKNNIVWFNVESVKYLVWSISNDDTSYGAAFSASSSIYSQRTRFHVTGKNKLSIHEPLDGYGRPEEKSYGWATREDIMPSAKTTRIVDVCWDNVREEMKCENKTVYIQMIYNKSELNQSIGKELMTPVIGIPIYTFTTFPDGKWFKIKYNQANKTYSFKKILQTPSLMRGIQSVERDMLYKRKFYDDGIYRFKGSIPSVIPGTDIQMNLDTYDLSEFIIKIIKDKYVMYTKDDKLISGMRSGTSPPNGNAWPSDLILNPVVIPKDKVNKTDYENAKFGLIGAMPFLHNFSNNGEIVPNKKYYSPNKKYYAIFIPNDGLYTKDAESDKYKVRIRTPNSTSTILYSSQMASGGSQIHSLIFYKENETVKADPDLFADWSFRQRIDTEKAIRLNTNKRRSFALVVTDVGELLCLDLYEGKIINNFEDYSKDVFGNDRIVRVNEPAIDPYQEQYRGYKGIHEFNPQIQKQLPKPIPCSIFLPKNNEDKYLTFEYGKRGKVTDKRSESTQLFIKQAENLTEKYPNSYEVRQVRESTFSSDTKTKKKRVLKVISPYSGTDASELSLTHCRTSDRGGCYTLTESQIKKSIPKYECLDIPTIPQEDWDVTYMDGNN